MPRDLTTQEKTVVTGKAINPAFFVEIYWPSGVARFWSGMGPITVGDDSFVGVGDMGGISPIKESSDGTINGMTLTLSGVPVELTSAVLSEEYQYRVARIYIGLLNSAGTLLFPLREIFSGRLNVASDSDDGTSATITLSIEPRMIVANQASMRRYTLEDQKSQYPDDLGLEFITAVNSQTIDNWGVPNSGIPYNNYTQPSP